MRPGTPELWTAAPGAGTRAGLFAARVPAPETVVHSREKGRGRLGVAAGPAPGRQLTTARSWIDVLRSLV